MKSFLIIIIAVILLPQISYAGTSHEIGFGSYLLKENNNFNTDFGFNLHFDLCPNNVLVLRTAIAGIISKEIVGFRATYRSKIILKDRFLILSLEKSLLYRINKGKYKPYAGIGIGFYSTTLADAYYLFFKSSKYTFGLNLCGGIKLPINSKWSSYIEVKQILFYYTAGDNNISYTDTSDGYNVTVGISFPNRVVNMNRFVINAGLSYRL
ncbi:MAG: hypothetical protein GY865_02890 [candidate division Zixibacteria bacterium]|nr:hypothetical protein [candidate division Zixibacteria bacterium]